MEFSELLKSINSLEETYPPVHLWNPDLCEGVEMRIDREGNWYYQNSIIGRDKLKILFSRILKFENGNYYLVTPVEKVIVKVDIAPYMIRRLRGRHRPKKYSFKNQSRLQLFS